MKCSRELLSIAAFSHFVQAYSPPFAVYVEHIICKSYRFGGSELGQHLCLSNVSYHKLNAYITFDIFIC